MPRHRTTTQKRARVNTRKRNTAKQPKRVRVVSKKRSSNIHLIVRPGIRMIRLFVTRTIARMSRSKTIRAISLYAAKRLSTILIVLGLLILFLPVLYTSLVEKPATPQKTTSVSEEVSPSATTPSVFGPIRISEQLTTGVAMAEPPSRIVIPALSIDLAIREAPVVNGYWEVSETTASHGQGSAYPGQNGNIVLFAHAREGLFAPLKNINKSDVVYVLPNNRWYRYQVATITTVTPDQIQIIAPTTTETLTLFTCTGFLDSKRLVITAQPIY